MASSEDVTLLLQLHVCPSCPPQTSSWQLVCESRSSACGSPPSLRYHSSKQLALSPLSPPSPQPPLSPLQGEGPAHWEDSIRLCVLVGPGGVQVPLCCVGNLGDFLLVGAHRSSELCFPLTTVDGRRPDDISVGILQSPQGCSRTALSQGALRQQPPAAPQARCWSPQTEEGSPAGEDGRREEKLTQMYERLRVEVRALAASRPGSACPPEGICPSGCPLGGGGGLPSLRLLL